jgi:hypothetical protein
MSLRECICGKRLSRAHGLDLPPSSLRPTISSPSYSARTASVLFHPLTHPSPHRHIGQVSRLQTAVPGGPRYHVRISSNVRSWSGLPSPNPRRPGRPSLARSTSKPSTSHRSRMPQTTMTSPLLRRPTRSTTSLNCQCRCLPAPNAARARRKPPVGSPIGPHPKRHPLPSNHERRMSFSHPSSL